ncbi:MAG: hypothetical protein [Microviridae sp.]|nr:MAG: hypothetical protein [Microviridae sp.]
MAKGNSKRGSAYASASSLTSLLSPSKSPTISLTPSYINLSPEVLIYDYQSDRRRFRPDASTAPPGATRRASTRLNIDTLGKRTRDSERTRPFTDLSPRISFAVPKEVHLCQRRKTRREVLHALYRNRIAKLGAGHKPRRRNAWSRIRC